jgi:hypothetical protein
LKTLVQRPSKSTDQFEKEYLEDIAARTDRDEEKWPEAVSLLDVDRLKNDLSQEEQRTVAIIDEYYASLRADQARQKVIRATERIEEHKRAAIYTQQCNVGEKPKSYM